MSTKSSLMTRRTSMDNELKSREDWENSLHQTMPAPVMSSSPAWATDINLATHRRNAVSITQLVYLRPAPALLQWIISCEHKHPAVRQLDNRKRVPTAVSTCDGRDTGTGLTWHTPKGLQLLEVSWRTLSLSLSGPLCGNFPFFGILRWNFLEFCSLFYQFFLSSIFRFLFPCPFGALASLSIFSISLWPFWTT